MARRARRKRSVRRLVRMLRRIQRDRNWSNEAMALEMGLSPSTLGMVYRGRRNPGPRFLRSVLHAFPELSGEVWLCFRDERDRG